ncbi:MAG TPA: hypothetical protein VEK07_25740 [Polyangiaceae bacterium]|nr:hypothetical protein [Polyangiaceae bacterium]
MASSAFSAKAGGSSERPPAAPGREDDPKRRSRASAVRAQAAIVRALADTLELYAAGGSAPESLREQLVEELARLGLRPSRKVSGGR